MRRSSPGSRTGPADAAPIGGRRVRSRWTCRSRRRSRSRCGSLRRRRPRRPLHLHPSSSRTPCLARQSPFRGASHRAHQRPKRRLERAPMISIPTVKCLREWDRAHRVLPDRRPCQVRLRRHRRLDRSFRRRHRLPRSTARGRRRSRVAVNGRVPGQTRPSRSTKRSWSCASSSMRQVTRRASMSSLTRATASDARRSAARCASSTFRLSIAKAESLRRSRSPSASASRADERSRQ